VQLRHRRALRGRSPAAVRFSNRERTLFSPRTWQLLPELLEDLLARERILLCPLDDVETGRMVGMGASGFLDPDFLDAAFAAESEGRPAFLNRKEIAEANRAADLRLMNIFGTPRSADVNDPVALEILGVIAEAWTFYHRGFA